MQQYPNYWMNNYPQYQQQPVYQNSPQQMQQNLNPYMDHLNQLRNMQQVPQQQYYSLSGKIVDDFDTITANDVPMDGTGAIFIKRDGSEIQVRNWTAQGTISTNVFKPVFTQQPNVDKGNAEKVEIGLSDDVTMVLQKYFEQINERFDKLEKSFTPLD